MPESPPARAPFGGVMVTCEARAKPSRVGVLVLQVWRESGDPTGLRIRIRATDDVQSGDEQVSATASVEQALDVVRQWLDRQVGPPAPAGELP